MRIIPEQPTPTPNYWCTWGCQNYAVDEASFREALGLGQVGGLGNHTMPARALDETTLFGPEGWARSAFAPVRRDCFVLVDVGWDVSAATDLGRDRSVLGSLIVADDKFPCCAGQSPVERLRTLDARCRELGWRGLALWVASQEASTHRTGDREAYWRERLDWSREAGIGYWKVDYGAHGDVAWRRWLSGLAAECAPELIVEHGRGSGPTNDLPCPWDDATVHHTGRLRPWGDGSVLATQQDILRFAGVWRSYDVTPQLSIPTTLDRVAENLAAAAGGPRCGLVNAEDEAILAAVLGCAIGIMRHPAWRVHPGCAYDPFELRLRSDEVARAIRWQRLAPARPAHEGLTRTDATALADRWTFRPGDTWARWFEGETVGQGAPARVARDLPLPEVHATGDAPYVLASRHPSGACAVAVLPRLRDGVGPVHPPATITLDIGDAPGPIAVFGHVERLTIRHRRGRAPLLAQDLLADEAEALVDALVERGDDHLTLPGDLLARIGTAAATPGDRSDPGCLIAFA